jgi:CBS domain-containing protein/nucleotide-binding universal stress UspA family protein
MKLKTLLTAPAITIQETAPIHDARALMRRHAVRCLAVLRKGDLVGIITDLHLDAAGPSSVSELRRHDWESALDRVTVAEVMARRPRILTADTPVAEAARLARAEGLEAFPVTDGGVLAGVVTRGDLLAALSNLLGDRRPTALGHILAATSLRSGLDGAIGEAIRLASTLGAALTALHVLRVPGPLADLEGATAQDVKRVERARQAIAREAVAAMCSAGRTHEVSCDVGEGVVATEIARRAAELDSDLIVIGKTTPRGLRMLAGGRTYADQLVRLAPCPVLAIPREPRRREARASR